VVLDLMYFGVPVAYPEVVPSINIPLNIVSFSFGGKGMIPVRFRNLLSLCIGRLLVRFVVPVIRIELECYEQMSFERGGFHTKFANFPISCLETC